MFQMSVYVFSSVWSRAIKATISQATAFSIVRVVDSIQITTVQETLYSLTVSMLRLALFKVRHISAIYSQNPDRWVSIFNMSQWLDYIKKRFG